MKIKPKCKATINKYSRFTQEGWSCIARSLMSSEETLRVQVVCAHRGHQQTKVAVALLLSRAPGEVVPYLQAPMAKPGDPYYLFHFGDPMIHKDYKQKYTETLGHLLIHEDLPLPNQRHPR